MRPFDRRDLFRLTGAATLAGTLSACGGDEVAEAMPPVEGELTGPEDALRRLMDGNERWMKGETVALNEDSKRRAEVASGQEPFATILSCVDSRVPPELVFDRGVGDLFVIRTAGHVVDDVVMGSIEFGAEELHIPLIMVMGHERCGAIKATVAAVKAEGSEPTVESAEPAHGDEAAHGDETAHDGAGEAPANSIGVLVERLRPAVMDVIEERGDVVDKAVDANVFRVVEQLEASPTLKHLIGMGKLRIVGARYDLDSGRAELIP